MGFSTGSVVVPACSETMDTCCRVIALSRLDLPTFRLPNRLMWRRRPLGALAAMADPPSLLGRVRYARRLMGW